MNFKEICELIDLVARKGIPLVEVEQAGVKVKIRGTEDAVIERVAVPRDTPAGPRQAPNPRPAEDSQPVDDPDIIKVASPMVGTFYRAPNPEADPFVAIGDRVSEGKVLCIIEAMKLMNEIESDYSGEVVAIYPENGEPVEFGQDLFAIKKT